MRAVANGAVGAADRRGGLPRSVRAWLLCTAPAALIASCADALLLDRKRGIFTGGFLSADRIDTLGERLSFACVSIASDAALAGVLVAAAYAVSRRLHLRSAAAHVFALCCGVVPFAIADTLSFQLYRYFGDAVDMGTMFDLAGRSTRELLAVTWGHLGAPLGGALLGIAAIGAVTAAAQWLGRGAAAAVRVGVWLPLVLFVTVGSVQIAARVRNDVFDDALRRKLSGQVYGALAEAITDFDRDGFGMLGRPADPAAFDARVYPYATDWPGNGVDEDGVGGDLPAGSSYTEGRPMTAWRQHPAIVLIVLESFRADAVGAHVNGRAVTPVLDGLAAAGVSSAHAYSHNGYTAQSRFHLLTGSLAGLRGGTSLVDDFKRNGYEVGYFSGQDDSFGGAEFAVGEDRADVVFDARSAPGLRYSTFATAGSLAVASSVVEERISQFLDARNPRTPLFLYVNLEDTHFPYHHPGMDILVSPVVLPPAEITPERGGELREMYLNAAANVDRAIGRILGRVEAHLGTRPGVVVTGDHGESLFDEGFLGHGYALNDAQTRVPLVVANLPLHIPEPFGQADLRDAINAALESPDRLDAQPVLVPRADRALFQYVGRLDRPRMISMVQGGVRVSIDLHAAHGPHEWAPARLELLRTWEAMLVARAAARREDRP